MKEILLKDFKAGKVVEYYTYCYDDFIVFSKHLILTDRDIERARKFNLDTLYYQVDDSPVSVPIIDEILEETEKIEAGSVDGLLQKKEDTAYQKPEKQETVEIGPKPQVQPGEATIYGSAVAFMHKEFSSVLSGNKIDISRINKITTIILEYISNVQDEALLHISRGRAKHRLGVHSVNTALLAALTASCLKVKGRDLINTVSGALLHDIGILFIKDGSGIDEVRKHPLYGFQHLKSIKNIDPALVMPALQHHEKAGGDGYPNKTVLNNIESSSRITSVCDFIDNQISFIKFGNDISIHFQKDQFLTWKKDDFDPQVFMGLITSLNNVFKKESVVQLNNECLALIKKTSIRFPLNPVVQLISDQKGNKTEEVKMIDLIRTKDIWIKRFINIKV